MLAIPNIVVSPSLAKLTYSPLSYCFQSSIGQLDSISTSMPITIPGDASFKVMAAFKDVLADNLWKTR